MSRSLPSIDRDDRVGHVRLFSIDRGHCTGRSFILNPQLADLAVQRNPARR